MVSSWLSPDVKKSQDTSKVEPIKSLLHSLNLKRARLPGPLTFRDEPPGPDKSLCEIVSRISNCVDIDSKSMKERTIEFLQHNTIKNDSQESCNLNSRTESAIQSLSPKKNNEKDDIIYTGNCGTIYKRAHLNAESLATIRRWGSARSFAPKIGDINNELDTTESKNSQKKVVSALRPNIDTTNTPFNFNNEHWTSDFINSGRIFNALNERITVLDNKQSSNYLENTSTQTSNYHQEKQLVNRSKGNTVKKTKHLLLENVSQDKLSIDIGETIDEKKSKESNNDNPYGIHLSINNYFNSPRDTPLISPKRTKLRGEIDGHEKKLSKKNVMKIITKRKSLGKILRGGQQISRIATVNCIGNNEIDTKYQSSINSDLYNVKEVDPKLVSGKELSDNNNKKTFYKITNTNLSRDNPQISENCGKLNLINNRTMDYQRKKQIKMDRMRTRLEAVLCGERRTVAKPSEVLIPQSVRARHIFKPFANIQEQSEAKIRMPKNIKKKNSNPEHDQYTSIISKDSTDSNPMWKPNTHVRSLPHKQNTINQNNENFNRTIEMSKASIVINNKKIDDKINTDLNTQISRSNTFIPSSINSNVAEVHNDYREPLKINQMMENKKLSNRHLKSLQMLKEILASTDEDYVTEESFEYSDGSSSIGKSSHSIKKAVNDEESQSSQKFEMSQSLQTVSEAVEHLDASTETDVSLVQDTSIDIENSCDDFPSVSTSHFNQTFVDAGISCSFPTITSFDEESLKTGVVKTYRMIETQTSKTSFQSSCKEKDPSVETVQLRLHSKYVNTERRILIDSATGKDFLEIQNFCCDTQLTNTESSMFDEHSAPELKLQMKNMESQVNTYNSLINIGIKDTSSDMCASLISSLSNELISSGKSLMDSNQKREKIKTIPDEVIKAFEIATERAQNLYRAIEIYREHELKKQNELKSLSEENQKEKKIINLLREEERKSESLIFALEQISESEKAFQVGFSKFVLHHEVKIILETLIDQVMKNVKKQPVVFKNSLPHKRKKCMNRINSSWMYDLEDVSLQPFPTMSRTKILPIVYGAVCTLIFCSLQFSTSCEFG